MGDKKVTLELENVSKVFAKVESDEVTHALYNVSTTMESGEFISLVGPSGCGKSTLLNLIMGISDITKGNIYINNENIKKFSGCKNLILKIDYIYF